MFDRRHAGPPFLRRSDRPRRKAAAAVRADIVQLGLDAVGAERAFESADAGVRRVRRQVLVAIFAVRPELQRHGYLASLESESKSVSSCWVPHTPPHLSPLWERSDRIGDAIRVRGYSPSDRP